MSTPETPFAQVGSRFYPTLLALLAAFYLISNIAATKTMAFDLGFTEWVVDGGVFLFPLTYLIGGVIAEVYGFRAAFRAVLVGFSVMVIGAVVFGLVTASPATEGAWNQEAFEILFGWDGVYLRILVASLLAFLAGQLVNAVVIVRIKARFGERNLWARLMSSTVFGQIVDTFLFGLVAFSAFTVFLGLEPMMSWGEFGNYLVLGVIYKCLIEWVLLPVTYAVVGALKRREPSYLGGRPSR
ncbi:queuosine precursor transporter [Nesterenkonia flava]|uniref:Probable queuosine precursor transporter n=1 Tax=Nesterenkonia flava TaxID=469799 RepID=A0ABU1FV83_9MICC|nr:queuosine precursor transporter [Nesterenkonia flava]MDR5712177.1 queuosine precursor transporter [Nesterenkonia flava]